MGRPRLGVVLALLAAVAVAAAGLAVLAARVTDRPADGTDRLRASVDRTIEEGTAGIAFFFRVEHLPPDLGDVSVTGEGEVAFADAATELTVRVSPGMAEFSGARAGDVRLVDDGDEAFILPPGEERWRPVAADARRTADGSFDLLVGTDPTAGLAFLRGAAVAVEEDGTNEVRGEPATRYEVTLDPGRLEGDEPGAPIGGLLDALGFEQVFGYVWVDERGRVVRVRYDADLARLSGGGPFAVGGRFVTEFELFDLGAPFEAALPAPPDRSGDVVEARELERLLGGLGL